MQVVVIGSTGSLGSHITVELLYRGHKVVGISRSPDKLGEHRNYRPVELDANTATTDHLVDVFKGSDVIVWACNPDRGSKVYQSYLEAIRRVVQAVKHLSKDGQTPYFIMVGGTGSLELPGRSLETVLDHREWWLALQRYFTLSEAATEQRIEALGGPKVLAEAMRAYRTARMAVKGGNATDKHLDIVQQTEDPILNGVNPIPDLPLAARAALMIFDGNTSFNWSFLSPPAGFRGASRTGKYRIQLDQLPMTPLGQAEEHPDNEGVENRLLGISVADLALAIVHETEVHKLMWKHWTAVGELVDDGPVEKYARIQ